MRTLHRYAPPVATAAIELRLDRNEGRAPRGFPPPTPTPLDLGRYPDLGALEREAVARFGIDASSILVTAGGDDALLRLCLAAAAPGARALIASPTFEMIPRYAALAGLELDEVNWPEGGFPTADFLAAVKLQTRLAFVVSPNNPTGAVASGEDLTRISTTLAQVNPEATVVLDAAYAEFADEDLTPLALTLPNVVVVRTLSKAWGLAGLRVGYALGPPEQISRLAAAGNPFPVSSASATAALARLATGEADLTNYVASARRETARLTRLFEELGAQPARPSQANFILVRGLDSERFRDDLASLGIGVRAFPGRAGLEDAVRIAVPGDPEEFARLERTIQTTLAPEAILFDLDGVLADVSGSYRAAILGVALELGVELSRDEISAAKARGHSNDDWALTHRLLAARGVDIPLEEVTRRFERLYQGTEQTPGLCREERLLLSREQLVATAKRYRLGIVTGRPAADARAFLERFGISDLFESVVTREDAPLKPDPAPVRLALEQLGAQNAWMIGDTPDDLRAARGAGVLPIGVVAPGTDPIREQAVLLRSGASQVLFCTENLLPLLP